MADLIPQEKMNMMLDKIGMLIVGKAKELVPIDEGMLKVSIKWRIISEDTVQVYSDSPYAEDMEYGKNPGILSNSEKDNIMKWAERHGVSGRGVIKKIEKKGIEVGTVQSPLHIDTLGRDSYRPFLRPAAFQSKPMIIEIIKKGAQ